MKIRNILTVALLAATSSMALTTAAAAETAETKTEWWPKKVDLTALRQNEARANPYGDDFNYAAEFATLDLDAVKADIRKTLTTSQPRL